MSDATIRALATALFYAKHYDDSNPDVGMGPSLETLCERVFRTAEANINDHDIERVVFAYKTRWGNG